MMLNWKSQYLKSIFKWEYTINKIINDLKKLGLSTEDSFSLFNNRTRDMDNLNVLKYNKSDVIVLEYIQSKNNSWISEISYNKPLSLVI